MLGWILLNRKTMEEPSIQMLLGMIEQKKLDIKAVDVTDVEVVCEPLVTGKCYIAGESVATPDFAICAFFGGNNYQSKAVVKMLESLGTLCVNSSESLSNTADKLLTFQKLAAQSENILFPKTLLMTPKTTGEFVGKVIGFPCVVKVMHGSKGKGVVLVRSEKEMDNILDIHAAITYDDSILVQECIEASRGRDLRIMLSGGKYSTAYIRDNGDNFKSNLSQGGDLQFLEPPKEVIDIAEKAAKILDIYFGSVDFLMGFDDTYYICEANSMTGLTYTKSELADDSTNPIMLAFQNIMMEAAKRKKK